ncbi:phosphatidylinositol-specific phospholipase C domain-containing protein [Burkholderia sp. 22PA0099]|uniref:phosphatidylinositol-specific phospholipase C domain-containing protein n=1 Tax=Burkholderia sp. 22PA0099 TaxID=3237372 RepID=UPI0039C14B29
MSYGCQIGVVNLGTQSVKVEVSLENKNDWELDNQGNPVAAPTQLNGLALAGNGRHEVHAEIANGQSSAKFLVTFRFDNGEAVEAWVDARQVVDGGKRQGCLAAYGQAAGRCWMIEAQYDKQPWDTYSWNWRHLTVVVMPKADTRSWISRLPDSVRLHELTLPGSHDTGTAAITSREDDAVARSRICQGLSISQQLAAGIRFLDIRINKSLRFEIMHESTPTALWFWNDCVRPVVEFLQANSHEVVVMCVKDEHGSTDGFHDAILDFFAKAPYQDVVSHVSTSQVPPTLGDLRGKLVLLRRYWIDPATNHNKVGDPNSGVGLTEFKDANGNIHPWPKNSDTFDQFGDGNVVHQQPGNLPFAIQDWYDLQTRMMASKVELIVKYLDYARNKLPDAWFVNFTSCTASGHGWDDPRAFAVGEDGINAALVTYLITHGKGRYGTIPMDYVGNPPEEILIDLMINSNF